MPLTEAIQSGAGIIIRQKRELAELIGFETRNKYSIETDTGALVGFAAEQQKGLLGIIMRQFLGHWRTFDIMIFDVERKPILRASHPFRWFFQRLEVRTAENEYLGALQQRWAILSKRFDLEGPHGEILAEVRSPIWSIWTFEFRQAGSWIARIEKKWSGLMKEMFLDADNFRLQFNFGAELPMQTRLLLLASGIFVDLQYFENKGGGGLLQAAWPD